MSADGLGAIYPLTPMQQGMLFHTLSEPASAVYFEQLTCTLAGELDGERFARAWQLAVERHAVLRTAFVWQGLNEPVQVVHDSAELPIELLDWRALASASRADRLEAFLSADRRRGFALAEAPLSRLALICVGASEHWLVWSHHHLLLDGWSLPILLGEVFEDYAALRAGPTPVRAPAVPYRDYVAWIRRHDAARAEGFWRRALAGFRAPTPLSWLGPRSTGEGLEAAQSAFEEQTLELGRERSEALRAFARRHRLTVNTLFQGAWALILARASRDPDVVFGATVSGRPPELPGVESMVGLFINTLPLRARAEPAARLVPWLAALQEQQAAARDFEWSPLADVQRWSEVPRGTALFDSLLVFENYPFDGALLRPFDGVRVADIRAIERTNYALTLAVKPGENLELALGYPRSRLSAAAAAGVLGSLRTLLDAMLTRPEARLAELPLLTAEERVRVLARAAGPSVALDDERCLHDLVRAQAARTPAAVALVSAAETVTYAELVRRVQALAARVRELGARPEAVVGLCCERSLDGIVALLAILEAGAAYLPLDPSYPRERLAFQIRDARATLVLVPGRHAARIPESVRVLALDDREACAAEPRELAPVALPANLAYVLYTSGSTGTPKGVMVPHRNVCHRLLWGQVAQPLEPGDAVLQKSSWSFDVSLWEIFAPLVAGARLVLAEPGGEMDPAYLVRTIAAQRVTVMDFVPSLLALFLEEPGLEALSSLRRVTCGGEALPAEVAARFAARLGATLHNFYGPTETTIDATTWTSGASAARTTPGWTPPIGKPVGNARVYVLDEALEPVPDGLPGELFVGGPGVARGYLARPERTAEAFVPDPFGREPGARLYRTGDLARRLPDGDLEFLGRRDEQVKLRGYRVELGEIEAALGAHEGVREAVVALREDEPLVRRLAAYVVAKGRPPAPADLRTFLRTRLPEHMVPATFTLLDALPRSASGKVERRALPRPEREARTREFVAPRNASEETLAGIWASVLRLERVSVHDDFFELGGDSILAIQIVSRTRDAGLVLTPRHVFEHPTIAELATRAGTVEVSVAEQGPVSGAAPLTPIQHWFFEEEFAEPQHWNQALMLEVPPGLDAARTERALGHLVAHHDALRLRFARGPSGWTQTHAGLEAGVPFERHELAGLLAPERARALVVAAEELQRALDIARGPLFRAAWFDLGDGRPARLLLVAQHLVVDAVSWRVLLEDLWTAAEALRRGDTVELPPKTTSFAAWAAHLDEHARGAALERELPHWLAQRPPVAPLPVDAADGANDQRSARTVTLALERDETRALLQDARAAYRTEINDLLLAALADAFAKWTGERRLLVDLEGHGRETTLDDAPGAASLDLSRTVGWFTSVFPVLLDLSAARGPGETIRTTKETLRAIPRRGLGYGLLRWMRGDPELARKLREQPQAQVSFNYLGQIDASLPAEFRWAAEPVGSCLAPAGRRTHLLDVNATVSDGRLEVEWTYSESRHRRETIERLAARYLESLRALVVHCQDPGAGSYTPSDFPDTELDQKELDRILAAVRGPKKGARR